MVAVTALLVIRKWQIMADKSVAYACGSGSKNIIDAGHTNDGHITDAGGGGGGVANRKGADKYTLGEDWSIITGGGADAGSIVVDGRQGISGHGAQGLFLPREPSVVVEPTIMPCWCPHDESMSHFATVQNLEAEKISLCTSTLCCNLTMENDTLDIQEVCD